SFQDQSSTQRANRGPGVFLCHLNRPLSFSARLVACTAFRRVSSQCTAYRNDLFFRRFFLPGIPACFFSLASSFSDNLVGLGALRDARFASIFPSNLKEIK